MKKQIMQIFIVIILLMFTACNNIDNEFPYTLKSGTYEFKYAVIKDSITDRIIVKSVDDILFDREQFDIWGDFLNIRFGIDENTEYCVDGTRRYVVRDGLLYEIVFDNLLNLYLPHWQAKDSEFYDIVIFFGWSKNYL